MSESKINRLHPMAIGLLALKSKERPVSHFIYSAYSMISNRPNALTDKWIEDINTWCEQILSGMELGEQASFGIGDKIQRLELTVVKRRAKKWGGFPALITEDGEGWRYWMVWPGAFEYSVGDKVNIEGTVRDIKDGMVFLTRPSNVTKAKKK
jgi:hypothetical protein